LRCTPSRTKPHFSSTRIEGRIPLEDRRLEPNQIEVVEHESAVARTRRGHDALPPQRSPSQ
jgi:hypothetical protein